MMTILIIGSNGFIGKSAVYYFIQKGWEVYGCDLQEEPPLPPERFERLDANQPDFERIFRQHPFDYCLNASGAANVGYSLSFPQIDFRLNVWNVVQMLEAVRRYNPACKFLTISSAAVYGNPRCLPIDERHPIEPLSPYGWHKYQSELLCQEYYRFYGIRTACIRVFSAYGPGLRKQLFWDLYRKAQENGKIQLFGTGEESRDFIYITDLLQAIELVFQRAGFEASVLNVANGEEITISYAAKLFCDKMESKSDLTFTGEQKSGDPLHWRANINQLKALGYQRQCSFEQGIEYYLQWLKEEKLV